MIMHSYILLLTLVTLSALAWADDIDTVCSSTPHPAVCTSTLKADPKSQDAPAWQLGFLMVTKVESTMTEAEQKAKNARASTSDPALKSALGNCLSTYYYIITGSVVASQDSFRLQEYKFAVDYMADTSRAIATCEKGISAGKSPVTQENDSGAQLADVAAAIARYCMSQ